MRVSSYLISAKIPEQPFFVLLHGYTGAVDKVPAWLGSMLLERRGQTLSSFDPILEKVPDQTLQVLTSRGYLTTLDHQEERSLVVRISAALHERDVMASPTGFMLIPSYLCNLRCSYCFQSHDMHVGRGTFSAVMTREQVDQAFAVIDRFDRGGAVAQALGVVDPAQNAESFRPRPASYKNKVGLFGGEPLSSPTLSIVTYILHRANQRGKSVSAITNGVELAKFGELLGPGKIEELQITLDGAKGVHDTRRIGPEFRQTFDTIVENIDLALSRDVDVRVRLNVDSRNVDAVAELSAYFKQRGWSRHGRFWAYAAAVHSTKASIVRNPLPLFPAVGAKNQTEPLTQADLANLTMSLRRDSGGDYTIASYEDTADEVLAGCLTNDEYPFRRGVNCAAETGALIFDPHGDVYACWEEVGDQECRIATYDGNGLVFNETVGKQWLSRFPGAIEECSNCPFALIHTSGCAAHAKKMSGTMFASACESFKEYFPQTFAQSYLHFETLLRQIPDVAKKAPVTADRETCSI